MFRQAWVSLLSSARTQQHDRRNQSRRAVLLGTAVTATTIVSYQTRKWRSHRINELPSWQELYQVPAHYGRSTDSITTTLKRAMLMGRKRAGVSQELEDIRKWHVHHGYKGGLVLRELNTPLHHSDGNEEPFEWMDAMALARRECYYLYYELKGNGEIRQEIFCRGTTLGVDVLTCLQFWWKYDDDLECHIHGGFLNHANHLLRDVLPLLAPPKDKRATIEISGHSLGGAVAFLLAIKLKLLGYNVVKLTTVGAPRFCHSASAPRLSKLLPPDTLRIEDDWDIVTYLPPFASSHLGDKLWLVHDGSSKSFSCRYVPFPEFSWTESVWINLKCHEVLSAMAKNHRVKNYIESLLGAMSLSNEDGTVEDNKTNPSGNVSQSPLVNDSTTSK
jgi:pimeloyl-ACP methyl ester carboxylesterase